MDEKNINEIIKLLENTDENQTTSNSPPLSASQAGFCITLNLKGKQYNLLDASYLKFFNEKISRLELDHRNFKKQILSYENKIKQLENIIKTIRK